jgi:hypothetical protein
MGQTILISRKPCSSYPQNMGQTILIISKNHAPFTPKNNREPIYRALARFIEAHRAVTMLLFCTFAHTPTLATDGQRIDTNPYCGPCKPCILTNKPGFPVKSILPRHHRNVASKLAFDVSP